MGRIWLSKKAVSAARFPSGRATVDPANPDVVYVGNDIGVFFTFDGGNRWFQIDTGAPEAVMVHDLNVSPVNRKLRIFTHGLGAWQTDLYDPNPSPPDTAPTRTLNLR